jgi:predicted DNA-binding protein (MmcQ/YjbR family)
VAEENWNPYFRALWDYCSAKPAAVEDHPWGETVFKVGGKVFAFLGLPDRGSVTVKAPPEELNALLALSFIRRSAYIGRYGWITVSIADAEALELGLQLVDRSYDLIVGKTKRGQGKTIKKRGKGKTQPP